MAKPQLINPVCEQIGKQLKLARKANGMTLEQLASKLDISYQQLQKYETGANRISADKLWKISQLLNVSILDFFVELGENPENVKSKCVKSVRQIIRLAERVEFYCK